jgi:protein phosphatase-4 regulatory subunit 3
VYELRDGNWHDRGTGQCKGIYDDSQDLAALIVESEDMEKEGEGGFLKEEMLLHTKVEKDDIYQRQQGTCCIELEYTGNVADEGNQIR